MKTICETQFISSTRWKHTSTDVGKLRWVKPRFNHLKKFPQQTETWT